MRSAGNFHPEWGYLAPAPSFIRTVRIVLVAAAVGATAGAGVVLSLLDRPADVDVATRTLAAPTEAAVNAPPQAAPATAEAVVQNRGPPVQSGTARSVDQAASESQTRSTVQSTQVTASLAETPAADGASAPKKTAAKKHRSAPLYAGRGGTLSGDYYGAAGGLFMNGANFYRADRWGYQDRDYYDR